MQLKYVVVRNQFPVVVEELQGEALASCTSTESNQPLVPIFKGTT